MRTQIETRNINPPSMGEDGRVQMRIEDLWRQAGTPSGAGRLELAYNLDMLLPKILTAAAAADGDMCELGEAVYKMIEVRFGQIARNMN